jgi:hypothetical protein
MVKFCAVCGCCTRTDIVREHLEGTLRICDVSAMGSNGSINTKSWCDAINRELGRLKTFKDIDRWSPSVQ